MRPIILMILLCAAQFNSQAQENVKLKYKTFLDNQVKMKIPVQFTLMGPELMMVKYPMKNHRPDLMYTNNTGGINVGYHYTDNKLTVAGIERSLEALVAGMTAAFKDSELLDSKVVDINGRKVGYLEMMTQAADTKIYNRIFFTDLNGKMLLCSFNCSEKWMKDWKEFGHEIMYSLKVKPKK